MPGCRLPDEVGAEQIYQKLQEHEEMMGGHPVNSPVEVGSEIPIIIQGFWHHPKVVGNGISEPSTM